MADLKNISFKSIMAATLYIVVLASCGYLYADNALWNPGFEALGWPPQSWNNWDGSASGNFEDGVTEYISTSVAHTGGQSAVCELRGAGIRWGGYTQDIGVLPSEAVTASGWLMSPSSKPLANGGQAYIELKFLNASGADLAVYKSQLLTSAGAWSQYTITQNAPQAAAKARFSFVLVSTTNNGSGAAYFDDASLQVPPAEVQPAVEIISPINNSVVYSPVIPVTGTAGDNSIASVVVNGTQIPCFDGKWEAHVAIVQGENTITAQAADSQNTAGTDNITVTYSTTNTGGADTLFYIVYPADGTVYYETPAVVTATLVNPPDLYININGKEYLAVNGSLIAHMPLLPGENILELKCKSGSGTVQVRYINVTLDTSLTDFGGAIANNSFENSSYPPKDWTHWSGNGSSSVNDGCVSFISTTYTHTGLQASALKLYGRNSRWGGLSQEFPVTENDTIDISGYMASFTSDDPLYGGAEAYIELKFLSSYGNEIARHFSNKVISATNAWQRLFISRIVPRGAVTAVLSLIVTGPDGSRGTAYFDDISAYVTPSNYTPPGDIPFDKPQAIGSVQISGGRLMVNGSPFTIKGVCYQPTPIGYGFGGYNIYNDAGIYNRDLAILRDMGVNTIRTYSRVTSKAFLDACYNSGSRPIYVIMGYYIDGHYDLSDELIREAIKGDFLAYVYTFKSHPAVLMWAVGNETELTYGPDDRHYYTLLNELAETAYLQEGSAYHPVTAVMHDVSPIGDRGLLTTDDDMDYLDVWGSNDYEGMTFGITFDDFAHRSEKILWMSEFGVDAWHTNNRYGDPASGYVDESAQKQYGLSLWDEIASRADVCGGGTYFEYSDEWCKNFSGSNTTHDYGGWIVDNALHPDGYSNEEWYGLVAVRDNGALPDIVTPRQVVDGLRTRWVQEVEPPKMHVGDIAVSQALTGHFYYVGAEAVVTIYDENNVPVAGAVVYGKWTGLAESSGASTTDGLGTAIFESLVVPKPVVNSQFTFTVTDVVLDGYVYDAASNTETSDSVAIPARRRYKFSEELLAY